MSASDDCPGCKNNRSADSGETLGKIRASQGENRVLVTGAAGFTGKRLVTALAARGYRARALVRHDNDDAELKAARAQIYTGDIRDPKVVDWAMDGVTGVYHLASIVQKAGISDQEFWDTHVRATELLLEAARKYGVRKIVHCSTIGVLGHIAHPPADETAPYNVEDIYQITKAEGEKKALAFFQATGLPVTVVRPAAVYGPGDTRLLKLFRLIARGRFYIIGDGAALIHPVYV
ncbi:MAG: NAD-dependent epimerase/dehydratase family protein, partial [Nitrospinae bacterium]|nr:NAD-dependent epimerase/dehydratase family protein [Nitrospinota bacterium]